MRKTYLDNLRWVVMLELVLMHVCMAYNSSRIPYYFTAPGLRGMDAVLFLSEPWRQTAFFLAAGMSMRFSWEKHGLGKFLWGRVVRIALPFVVCKLTLIPEQHYMSAIAYGSFQGSFFSYLKTVYLPGFFTSFAGMDAQLWFLRVLLVDTAAAVLLLLVINRGDRLWRLAGRADARALVLLTLPVALMGFTFRVGVYHYYGRYFIVLLLGYLLCSHEEVCQRLQDRLGLFAALFGLLMAYLTAKLLGTCYYSIRSPLDEGLWYAAGWLGALTCLGFFRKYLGGGGRISRYFSGASYFIYLTHQNLLLWVVYGLTFLGLPRGLNYLLATAATTAGSLALYEIVRRIPLLRTCFGISVAKDQKT